MRIFILLSLALLLGGCQSFNEMLPDEDSSVFEPPPLDYSVPATSSGGLYRQGYGGSLYQEGLGDGFGLGESFRDAFDLRDSEQLLVKLSYRFEI